MEKTIVNDREIIQLSEKETEKMLDLMGGSMDGNFENFISVFEVTLPKEEPAVEAMTKPVEISFNYDINGMWEYPQKERKIITPITSIWGSFKKGFKEGYYPREVIKWEKRV